MTKLSPNHIAHASVTSDSEVQKSASDAPAEIPSPDATLMRIFGRKLRGIPIRYVIGISSSAIIAYLGLGLSWFSLRNATAPATVDFALPLQPGKADLLRNDAVRLTLSAKNMISGSAVDLANYECRPDLVPDAVAIDTIEDKPCAFILHNVGVDNRDVGSVRATWPLSILFRVHVSERSRSVSVPEVNIRFHDISRPQINAASFFWEGDVLQVRPTIEFNREEDTRLVRCKWRPADLFVEPVTETADCKATLKTSLPVTPPPVSVTVVFQAGMDAEFSAPATEDAMIVVPSRTSVVHTTQTPPALTQPTTTPTTRPTALPPQTKSQPTDTPVILGHAATASAATPATLLASLGITQGEDRYDHLVASLPILSQARRLTPIEITDLLGSLSGALRSAALSRLLPHLETPLSSPDALTLLQGLTSPDRADTLHSLSGCLVTPSNKPALLAGIYGSDRAWVETALDAAGPCHLSPH